MSERKPFDRKTPAQRVLTARQQEGLKRINAYLESEAYGGAVKQRNEEIAAFYAQTAR